MRVLYVLPFLPHPPYSGGRTRLSQFVSHLARRHQITIACLQKADECLDLSWYNKRGIEIISYPRLSLLTIPTIVQSARVGSVYAGVNFSSELKAAIESLLSRRSFDLIHVVCSYTLRHLPEKLEAPLVVEEPNLESVVLKQYSEITKHPILKWLYSWEANQLEAMQIHGMRVSNRYICTSETDRATSQLWGDYDKVRVVPNGVDTDFYSPENSVGQAGVGIAGFNST